MKTISRMRMMAGRKRTFVERNLFRYLAFFLANGMNSDFHANGMNSDFHANGMNSDFHANGMNSVLRKRTCLLLFLCFAAGCWDSHPKQESGEQPAAHGSGAIASSDQPEPKTAADSSSARNSAAALRVHEAGDDFGFKETWKPGSTPRSHRGQPRSPAAIRRQDLVPPPSSHSPGRRQSLCGVGPPRRASAIRRRQPRRRPITHRTDRSDR